MRELTDDRIAAFIRESPWVWEHAVNKRQWKAYKRRQLNALIKAAEVFNSGSAFTPQPVDTLRLLAELKEWRAAMSVAEWGR